MEKYFTRPAFAKHRNFRMQSHATGFFTTGYLGQASVDRSTSLKRPTKTNGGQPSENRYNMMRGAATNDGYFKVSLAGCGLAEPKILEIPKHLSGITPPGTAVSALNQMSDSHQRATTRSPLEARRRNASPRKLPFFVLFFQSSMQETFESDSNFPLLIRASSRAQNITRSNRV